MEVKETCGINYPRSKPHFSPRIRGGKLKFLGVIVRYRNLSKVIVPRAILMAEGAIIVPKRVHPQTIRPRQWHVTRGDHTVKKEIQRRG